ncbi:MAG: hypothetical protein MUP55_01625, partial [Candidatus Aenigmarchaeota archaeon]|nr:hypothetical protein [Candidatus Aenigmarchaeota archaeon]
DDCYPVESVSVMYSIAQPPNQYNRSNTAQYNTSGQWSEGGGWYNYTWLDTDKNTGWYSINYLVSKSPYYSNNNTYKPNALFIAVSPIILDQSLNPVTTGWGWGEKYRFGVRVSDTDLNFNNITLWKRWYNSTKGDWENWTLINQTWLDQRTGQWVYFINNFTCVDMGLNQYKFRTVDEYNFSDEGAPANFSLEVDNVTVFFSTDSNTTVRRVGTLEALFKFRVTDTDLNVYPNGTLGRIWISENYTNYTLEYNCTTANSGYCYIYYNPGCNSTVGPQRWIGGTQDGCYQSLNTSTQNDFTIIGQLYVNQTQPQNNSVVNRNTTIILNATVWSDCSNENITDATVRWFNASQKLMNTTTGWQGGYYNTTWRVPNLYALGPNITYINSSRQNYDNGTNSTNLYFYGWSKAYSIIPSNWSEYQAGTSITVRCNIRDTNSNQTIESYNVSFYKNNTYQTSENTNSEGNAEWLWGTASESAGNYTVKCNISDNSNLYYNTSIKEMESIISIRRQLILDQIIV